MTGTGRYDIAWQRDGDLQRHHLCPHAVIQRGAACGIVVDPEWTCCRTKGNTPSVLQYPVDLRGSACPVGHEWCDDVSVIIMGMPDCETGCEKDHGRRFETPRDLRHDYPP